MRCLCRCLHGVRLLCGVAVCCFFCASSWCVQMDVYASECVYDVVCKIWCARYCRNESPSITCIARDAEKCRKKHRRSIDRETLKITRERKFRSCARKKQSFSKKISSFLSSRSCKMRKIQFVWARITLVLWGHLKTNVFLDLSFSLHLFLFLWRKFPCCFKIAPNDLTKKTMQTDATTRKSI